MLKYISIGLLLIFTSTFCGCNLDTDDEDKMPGDKFWESAANAEAFMLSVYQNLRKAILQIMDFFFMPVMYAVLQSRDRIQITIFI